MMDHDSPSAYATAVQDFRDARRRAALQDVLARVTGKSSDLLSFDESKRKLKGQSAIYRGLQEIPLNAIIGSVGRYKDFTRSFMPRRESDELRWARVKAQIPMTGFNPIEVYQIGEAYFVLDGNHRVSIARARGDDTIQAYVTEIPTKVSLSPDDSPDDLILKAELTDFLEQTHLDETRPGSNFRTSAPGAFNVLNQRIARVKARHPKLSWQEAASRWFEDDYLPFVEVVREKGLRRDFPGRTETDLYAWIIRRQDALKAQLGWDVPLRVAAQNLLEKASPRAGRVARRVQRRLSNIATPDSLETGPRAGEWRQWALATHREDHLFTDYLVPISGSPQSWLALDQALVLAAMEGDYVHGLHIPGQSGGKGNGNIDEIREKFENRLSEAGVSGELTVESGNVSRLICDYAVWTDVVIMNIIHPPGANPLDKMASGLHTIIHRSPRPLILVPAFVKRFARLLLAYDGSRKAEEALYIAAYLTGKWGMDLTVLTVESGRTGVSTLQNAKDYLENRSIQAEYHLEKGNPADVILIEADRTQADTILMGGYGSRPVFEVVIGSAVDRVLRESNVPVFLCR